MPDALKNLSIMHSYLDIWKKAKTRIQENYKNMKKSMVLSGVWSGTTILVNDQMFYASWILAKLENKYILVAQYVIRHFSTNVNTRDIIKTH